QRAMAGDEVTLPGPGCPVAQQAAVLQRQRPGQLDGTERPHSTPLSRVALEKHGSLLPVFVRIDHAEPALELSGERERPVARKPVREPEAPDAVRRAARIVGALQLPDLLAHEALVVDVAPVVVDPQLAPEGGERHAALDPAEPPGTGAAGIGGRIDVAYQARREAGLAERGDGKQQESQSASPQAGGGHEQRIRRKALRVAAGAMKRDEKRCNVLLRRLTAP